MMISTKGRYGLRLVLDLVVDYADEVRIENRDV